jgi:hypothetical protein
MGGNGPLPSTGIAAIDWIIYAGAAIGALALIWRTAVKPTLAFFNRLDDYGPVIADIAREFKNNSGSSLKDTLDRLEANTNLALSRLDRIERKLDEEKV